MTNSTNSTSSADSTNGSPSRLRRAMPLSVLGLGLATAGILIAPSISAAQEDDSIEEPTTTEERPGAPEDFLAELVDNGTITQEQADAIAASLQEHRGDRGPGRHGHGPGDSTVVTDLLGIDADALHEQLRAGSSLAEVAEANGVDPQAVIDAIVAERQAHLDDAVADGNLTAEEAAEKAADLTERVTDRVNGEAGAEGDRGPRGRRGPHGPGQAPTDEEVTTTTDA